MYTLAIETSGRAGSIALSGAGEVHEQVELAASGRRHARTLVPEIRALLERHQLQPQQIELLTVSIGPGSFTGLRVGLVCAKTFAYAIGCSLVGVDTFLAVATAQEESSRVWVIEDALRGDVCAGEYCCENGIWKNVSRPRLLSFADWRGTLNEGVLVSGPGLEQFADQLTGCPLAPVPQRNPNAAGIARIGQQLFAQGIHDDPWTLEPFYMRRSAAEEKADAAGQRS